jgi:hypothetical protein
MVWLWLLLPIVVFFGTRLANTRLIVPSWRAGRLGSAPAALAVAALRGLIVTSLIAAVVIVAALPLPSGLLTAFTAGAIFFAVSRHPIRRMFERAEGGDDEEVRTP